MKVSSRRVGGSAGQHASGGGTREIESPTRYDGDSFSAYRLRPRGAQRRPSNLDSLQVKLSEAGDVRGTEMTRFYNS